MPDKTRSLPPKNNLARWLLLAILLLAAALRFYRLDVQSLWYDEAVTAQVARQGLTELARWTADDIQPPLYYLLVAGWTGLAGTSEWALRFPSALFGILGVALLYAAARRLYSRNAALLAALLGAIHPLWLYYSQEARMYTLLTTLGLLAAYALLRLLQSTINHSPLTIPHYLLLILTSIALLYTHYFAAFLLLAFALIFLLSATRRPAGRTLLLPGAAAALLILLAYLPWLPNALRRFQIDASYWQGSLKLDEALRHLLISLTTGETMLEAQATPLAWGMAALIVLCTVINLSAEVRGQKPEVGADETGSDIPDSAFPINNSQFTIIYFLLPILAILALAYRTPKFNPRYLMLASPGLLLLLAGALTPSGLRITHYALRLTHHALRILSAALILIFLIADLNWFRDPAFSKDDWRGAVGYIRSHIAGDETVILVSGHAVPAWRYYAPDIQPLRLPDIEILDTSAVLDLSTANTLNRELNGQQGAWLLQWQEEIVDPSGIVPFLLRQNGQIQPVQASFWGLGRPLHVRWPAGTTFASRPILDQTLHANFANQVELIGFSQPACPASPCPLNLFWQAEAPLQSDLKLSAALFDEAGHLWSQPIDRRVAAYDYPSFRWQPGATILSQLSLAPNPGTPPGPYNLRLSLYDAKSGQPLDLLDAAGAAQGRWLWLDPVRLDQLTAAPAIANPLDIAATPDVQLLSASLSAAQAEPGDRLTLETWWQASSPPAAGYQMRWQWRGPAGETLAGDAVLPAGPAFPTGQWPVAAPIHSQIDLQAPRQATPGPWQLEIGLAAAQQPRFLGQTAHLPLEILPSRRRFQPLPVQQPAASDFAGQIRLTGLSIAPPDATVPPGSSLTVTVTWQALSDIDAAYTGFVHLLDAQGHVVAQDDHQPLHGQRPTTGWIPGEYLADPYQLTLPADLPPGLYQLEIGLYDAARPNFPRLDSAALLGQILVE